MYVLPTSTSYIFPILLRIYFMTFIFGRYFVCARTLLTLDTMGYALSPRTSLWVPHRSSAILFIFMIPLQKKVIYQRYLKCTRMGEPLSLFAVITEFLFFGVPSCLCARLSGPCDSPAPAP